MRIKIVKLLLAEDPLIQPFVSLIPLNSDYLRSYYRYQMGLVTEQIRQKLFVVEMEHHLSPVKL
jgi:hypothetical protein